MIIIKFGGTSVQNEEAIGRVISIVSGKLKEKPLVVVSALAKVTRLLCMLAEEAEAQHEDGVKDLLRQLRERHFNLARNLLAERPNLLENCLQDVERLISDLETFVGGVCMIGELSPRSEARIISTGELLSSTIIAYAFNANGITCHWIDARRMITTDDHYLYARPDLAVTEANVKRIVGLESRGADLILTQGFVASTDKGVTSVLGFEGSDYSAAIFGMCCDAGRVEIWTDVDGIRSADPRIVTATRRIPVLSYEEAAEMAALGARVLHPQTIGPARSKDIPICVLNSHEPEGAGSKVCADGDAIPAGPKSIALLTAEDARELRSRTIFDVGCKAQVSVVGKDIAGQRDLIVAAIRSIDEGCAVSLAENGLSLSAIVEKDRAREIVTKLHNELFQ